MPLKIIFIIIIKYHFVYYNSKLMYSYNFSVVLDSTGNSKGYVFIHFGCKEEQKYCLKNMNGFPCVGSKHTKVSGVIPKSERHIEVQHDVTVLLFFNLFTKHFKNVWPYYNTKITVDYLNLLLSSVNPLGNPLVLMPVASKKKFKFKISTFFVLILCTKLWKIIANKFKNDFTDHVYFVTDKI